jgi:putative endonuclease
MPYAGNRGTTREIRNRKEKPTPYYVYMLLCDDGSYYTGYTSNVRSRLQRHRKGHGARYTRMRKPRRIVYVCRFGTRRAAMRRERQIKAFSHDQKRNLAIEARSVDLGPIGPRYGRNKPFRVT